MSYIRKYMDVSGDWRAEARHNWSCGSSVFVRLPQSLGSTASHHNVIVQHISVHVSYSSSAFSGMPRIFPVAVDLSNTILYCIDR